MSNLADYSLGALLISENRGLVVDDPMTGLSSTKMELDAQHDQSGNMYDFSIAPSLQVAPISPTSQSRKHQSTLPPVTISNGMSREHGLEKTPEVFEGQIVQGSPGKSTTIIRVASHQLSAKETSKRYIPAFVYHLWLTYTVREELWGRLLGITDMDEKDDLPVHSVATRNIKYLSRQD